MTLPLLVRGGSVLPLGSCDRTTDYPFRKDVELYVYGLAEGESCSLTIPSPAGDDRKQYTVRMGNGGGSVKTDADEPFNVHFHC